MELDLFAAAKELVAGHWPHVSAAAVMGVGTLATALFTYIRCPKSSVANIDPYFTEVALFVASTSEAGVK